MAGKVSDGYYQFDNDINSLMDAIAGNGVISGLAVTERGAGANMSVDVALGVYVANGTKVTKTGTTNVVITAAGASPRKDIIIADSAGNITAVAGSGATAAPVGSTGPQTYAPAPPDITTNKTILAEVWVPASAASIVNSYITDRRILKNPYSSAAGLDLADHSSRHEWLGEDEISIKNNFLYNSYPLYYKTWQDIVGFTETLTGTGARTAGWGKMLLVTGATNGSLACIAQTDVTTIYNNISTYYNRLRIRLDAGAHIDNATIWFGLLTNPTAPTATGKHIAFKIVNGDIYASCGDGTNGNLTDTTSNLGNYGSVELFIIQNATNIYYYINGVLKVTFTTYCPTAASTFLTHSILNTTAVNQLVYFYPVFLMQGV